MPLSKAEIARLRSLREKKHREASGLFVIEGEKVVGELLAAGYPLLEIYATPDWTGAPADGRVRLLTTAEMARASHFPTPSKVLAVGRLERVALGPDELGHGLTLALDGVQDAGNVGTLLRIADWFAFDRMLLSPDCADLFSQKVINASMGSFARVRTITLPLAAELAGLTVPVLGCALDGDDVHALRPTRDAVVVIGSEGHGLSEAVRKCVTRFVTIPRYGAAESLNAAVAAAVVCDNLRRTAGRPD
ncbi:MAG: TrmH family RNA methyltransferase [Opitutaceae bacterium]|nr:TrmH family RNA methyltransferase [Opitutaceae bacterium]